MDIRSLKVGSKVTLEGAAEAEVVSETEDGEWIKVRYTKIPDNPALEGTEDLCSSEEILEIAQPLP